MSRPNLSRLLTLEAPTRSPDGAGGYASAWAVLGTLWAEVAPAAARESVVPGARRVEQPLRITVRGRPVGAPSRPVAGQRFREGARAFPILAVREADPLGRFLDCAAHEESAL